VADSSEHGNEALGSVKSGVFLDRVTVRFSRRTLLHGVRRLDSLVTSLVTLCFVRTVRLSICRV
jgi:hypothetical protein